MNERRLPMERRLKTILIITVLLFIAVLSATLLAEHFMKPDTYSDIIISIDDRKSSVMSLAAASTVASAGISAIPDDTATPIADKLADLSGYFLLILIVLYAEKYLLTILGALVFRIIIPLACAVGIVSLFPGKQAFRRIAVKMAAVALLLSIAVPTGVIASNMVYEVYENSINTTIESAESFSKELNRDEESFWERLTGTVSPLINKASGVLSQFV
ncbi:MAG: hypothetical protein MJ175_13075, partial [Clostridia bacterium]|nr:hypothetical protein [Clostridia bacterium]